ncbi:hypothetical protein PUNSTDRAFT_134396 [Punctularia strigosozonata HHB-11173 SS5]|uniref:uncharacterized protein n=1 Tax=Punctularia strigosozonata (strain HHB-11173) TaxID=741275 RepID=UPI00044181FD|nr:uncharacterized protein PUNSTDRAFT_134396 [Punctularia strigosozonata HHB-11173 SS5]EIN09233.1 hypothetical protein PUNSTDRAFT_134396 [Punctularia strigosozonata HHB-11173 SS5]
MPLLCSRPNVTSWNGVAPRINAARFARYVGCSVRVPGRIHEHRGSSILLETVDGVIVEVRIPSDIDISDELMVEITGLIIDECTVECWWFVSFGCSLNFLALSYAIDMLHDIVFVGPPCGIKFDAPGTTWIIRSPLEGLAKRGWAINGRSLLQADDFDNDVKRPGAPEPFKFGTSEPFRFSATEPFTFSIHHRRVQKLIDDEEEVS